MRYTQNERAIRRAFLIHNIRSMAPGFLAAAIVIGFLAWAEIGRFLGPSTESNASTLESSTGQVISVIYMPVTEGRTNPTNLVSVRLSDGRLGQLNTDLPVQVGQAVNVRYRVGGSGRMYVQQVNLPDGGTGRRRHG